MATDVLTYHNDLVSTGLNSAETILAPTNVNSSQFGKLFSTPVDGQVYVQPLLKTGVNITTGASQGQHDVTYVATEHDSVYAIDSISGKVLWQDSFINAAAGVTTLPTGDIGTSDITPEYGITSAGVIDPSKNVLYEVVNTREARSDGLHNVYRLHAVDLGDGSEKLGGPIVIADTTYVNSGSNQFTYNSGPSIPGNGVGSINGVLSFNAERQGQRAALTQVNGTIYVTFGSHGDIAPDHGWILGYDASTLALNAVFCATPNGDQAGIWQSGNRLSSDAQGNLFMETGNGAFDPSKGNYGDSFIKLSVDPTTSAATPNINGWGLKVADYFTPFNQQALANADEDLGSGGVLLLPDSFGTALHPHLLIGSGKEGKIYLIDRDNMGKFDATSDHVVQESISIKGAWSSPALLGSTFYYSTQGDTAKAFTLSPGAFATTPSSSSSDTFAYPGATPSITANGTTSGIVWAIDRGTSQLRAYDASNLANELYTSGQAANTRDALGPATKFSVPTIANGRVFVGTQNSVVGFGLLNAPSPPASPTSLAAKTASSSEIDLVWTDNANNEDQFLVEQSTDGQTFTQAATTAANVASFNVTGLQANTTYTYRVRASNSTGPSGYSNTAGATTSFQTGTLNAPSELRAVATSGSTTMLTWTDNSTNATGFLIERKAETTAYAQIASVGAGVTTYPDTGLIANIAYTYRIRATNGTSSSFYSNESVLTTPIPPVTPSDAKITKVTSNEIDLAWNDNANNEDGYKILRKTGTGGAYDLVATLPANSTSYVDTAILPNTFYDYHIQAFNIAGYADFTGVNTTTPAIPVPTTAIDFSAGFAGSDSQLTRNGSARINGDRLTLTDGKNGESTSVWTSQPVSVTQFNTKFRFQLTNPNADGFTFSIQGNSATTTNGYTNGGSGLAYQGIGKSVAVKFDIYGRGSESNSTGLYTNGAAPTSAGSIGLSKKAVDLHSGDAFDVLMSYNGTALSVTITDTVTNRSASQSYNIDIPKTVGGGSAYVGFTAATGGQNATQEILSWTYNPLTSSSTLPVPWGNLDIGAPGMAGSARYSNGTFTVTGGGNDIWNQSDSFQFVDQALRGDGTIIARVANQSNTDPWAKAGIMIRSSIDPNSSHAMIVLTPGNGVAFQGRTAAGNSSVHTAGPGLNGAAWLKLVRKGTTFTGYASSDGVNYTAVGSYSIPMSQNVFIGLAVTSHNDAKTSIATFDSVQILTG